MSESKILNDKIEALGGLALLAQVAGPPPACCDSHNQHCEPPSELCCHACPEAGLCLNMTDAEQEQAEGAGDAIRCVHGSSECCADYGDWATGFKT